MESVLNRIKKALNLANRAGTEGEAQAAMARVRDMLAAHNLSMSDVKQTETPEEKAEMHWHSADKGSRSLWKQTIWGSVARLYFCEAYYMQKRKAWMVIGKPSNVAVAIDIAGYLCNSAESLASSTARQLGEDRQFANSFLVGFASRIRERVSGEIRKAKEGAVKTSFGTELIIHPLYNKAAADNKAVVLGHGFTYTSKGGRGMTYTASDGYQAGRTAGGQASMSNNGLPAGGSRKAIG